MDRNQDKWKTHGLKYKTMKETVDGFYAAIADEEEKELIHQHDHMDMYGWGYTCTDGCTNPEHIKVSGFCSVLEPGLLLTDDSRLKIFNDPFLDDLLTHDYIAPGVDTRFVPKEEKKVAKDPMNAAPMELLEIFARMCKVGTDLGYEANSWLTMYTVEQHLESLKRHIRDYERGKNIDKDGFKNLEAIMWRGSCACLVAHFLPNSKDERWIRRSISPE